MRRIIFMLLALFARTDTNPSLSDPSEITYAVYISSMTIIRFSQPA